MTKLLTTTCNVLACGLHELGTGLASALQLAADGVPTAWRLFANGPFTITKDGVTVSGHYCPEHSDAILAHAEKKGNRIPLDAEHGLAALADKLGVDEAELLPLLNRTKVTMGTGALEKRPDGLWLTDVQWVPLARKIMAEGVLKWFSPVIRGLQDGRLRITSVALTNTPALDHLDAIAATAESDDPPSPRSTAPMSVSSLSSVSSVSSVPSQAKGNPAHMKELLQKLAKLAGISDADAAALTADTADSALLPRLQAIAAQGATHTALLADLRGALALSADSAPEAVKGSVLALLEKSKSDTAALTAVTARVQALETAKTTADRQALIDGALAQGKLTPALVEAWAKTQDVATLTAFLAVAPVIIQPGRTVTPTQLPQTDTLTLSAEDTEVARQLGITAEAMLTAKKATQPA
jgi:phage I-like protein